MNSEKFDKIFQKTNMKESIFQQCIFQQFPEKGFNLLY